MIFVPVGTGTDLARLLYLPVSAGRLVQRLEMTETFTTLTVTPQARLFASVTVVLGLIIRLKGPTIAAGALVTFLQR